jgi:hypothetical protein
MVAQELEKSANGRVRLRACLIAVVFAASGCVGLNTASRAEAASTHPFVLAFTGTELPETSFSEPADLAVNQSTGSLYVLDAEGGPEHNGAVDVMTQTGGFVAQITGAEVPGGSLQLPHVIAVDNSVVANGQIYVGTESAAVYVFDATGKYIRTITPEDVPGDQLVPRGLAVDGAGNLFVANPPIGVIDEFTATGTFVTAISGSAVQSATRIAVNAADDIYVLSSERVVQLTPTGEEVRTVDTGRATAVAVDPVTQNAYVSHAKTVSEYEPDGTFVGRFGPPEIGFAEGLAVTEAEHIVVADRTSRRVDVFGPVAIAPSSETGVCVVASQTEATFNGIVTPDSEALAASYQFEYGTTSEYGSVVPATPQTVGTGMAAIPVSSTTTELEPNTVYHYRVVGSNANGRTEGVDRTCVTPGTPAITAVVPSVVTNTSATVEGEVAPDGADTHYTFEYGTTSAYELGSVPVAPGGDLGAAHRAEHVRQELSGLSPGLTYHFRLTAISSEGISHSPDETFTTFLLNSAPPDGRVYERVSPTVTENGEVYSTGGLSVPGNQTATFQPFEAAAAGNGITYTGDPSSAGNGLSGNEYLARRTSGGWQAADLSPVPSGPSATCPRPGEALSAPVDVFSPDLSKLVLLTVPNPSLAASTGAPLCFPSLFVRNNESNAYQATLTSTPPNRDMTNFGFGEEEGVHPYRMFAGASSELARVFFAANDSLISPALDGGPNASNLYEWDEGRLNLVNVLPDGATEPNATFGATAQGVKNPSDVTHAISTDGNRAFWTDLNFPTRLFVREDGDRTAQVDATQGGTGEGGFGVFRTASANGSRVFFTDGSFAGLTADTVEGSRTNLYMYEPGSGALRDLTGGAETAEVEGVLGASEDGSYVYFVATGDLAPGASGEEVHLYVWHEGSTKYIATLSAADNNFKPLYPSSLGQLGDWVGSTAYSTAEVTPDGRHAVFVAREPLTGAATGGQTEVYMYSAEDGTLTCASCVANGLVPTKPAFLYPSQTNGFQPRWISDDGTRVFFDSRERLVAQDKNGTWDVYEYEDGAVHMVSGGTGADGSYFDEATPTGSDVFFTTREALTTDGEDGLTVLIDARVGGGFPAEALKLPPCAGEACRGAPTPAPVVVSAASTSASSSGNLAPPATVTTKVATSKPKASSRATKLAAALKACKRKAKRQQPVCKRKAERLYGPVKKAKGSGKTTKSSAGRKRGR